MNETTAFTGIGHLTGNADTDSFIFSDGASVSGAIDGAGGHDTLDWSAYTTGREVGLTDTGDEDGFNGTEASIGGVGGFSNIDEVIGSSATDDTLTGANLPNAWSITDEDIGTLTSGSNDLDFAGFENLTGNADTDAFTRGLSGSGR